MNRLRFRHRVLSVVLSMTMLVPVGVPVKAADASAEIGQAPTVNTVVTYSDYRAKTGMSDAMPSQPITIHAAEAPQATEEMKLQTVADEQGTAGNTFLLTADSGMVTWGFDVPQTGWYALQVRYYPMVEIGEFKGKNASAQRTLYLDGVQPFSETAGLEFERIWRDDLEKPGEFRTDATGNELKPSQVECPQWVEKYLQDPNGYVDGVLYFYLTAGSHTLGLESLREPLLLDTLTFTQLPEESYSAPQAPALTNAEVMIQGETAARRSDQVLVPKSDRSSSMMQPYSLMETRLNYIGGTSWSNNGQWIEWDFVVKKAGYYCLDIKYKQQEKRGLHSSRRITIDGVLPHENWREVAFGYASGWQMKRLQDANMQAQMVYLSAGKHTLRMENTIGAVRQIANEVEESAQILSEVYRKVLMVVGNTPDTYRDYQITQQFPWMQEILSQRAAVLEEQIEAMTALTGEKSSLTSTLEKIVLQLKKLAKDPEQIAKKGNFDALKTNVGSLSSWVQEVAQQPLCVDYIRFCTPDMAPYEAKAGMWTRIWDYICQIAVTYVRDYNTLTGVGSEKTITVWYGSGRDQANIIKSLVDDRFTPSNGIQVDLKLIDPASVLMSAIMSGNAPDVALGITKSTPVNYALRGAVCDLSAFEGIENVCGRFRESALTPYRWQDGLYGLPETETFFMMFCREDVLDEMDMDIPQTWEDVSQAVTVLQRYNLEVALPDPATGADIPFAMFLYQRGGQFYAEDSTASRLNAEEGLTAFKQWTDYYTLDGFPVSYDAASRFRRGEIPILIADYSFYNTLVVSAPEISGKWSMAPVPGTKLADGTIDRSVASNSTACILLKQSTEQKAAFSFMSWWTSRDTQAMFGKELESVLGEAARYATANLEAQESISWSSDALAALREQGRWVKGIPEVPGGYFTPRHIENAFRYVTNNKSNARDALVDYVYYIDEEIRQKRKEFQLDH